jgi:cold-inducible RNA-binding protein
MIGNRQLKAKSSSGSMVYVSNLKYQVNEQEVMDFFKQKDFEPVRARLLYDDEGNSKGFGFVEFDSEDKANEAVEKLSGTMFQNRKINVSIKN